MLKKKLGISAIERNWPNDDDELKDYYKVPSTLIIPEGVEEIGQFAFWECDRLEKVIISRSVEEIGFKAFFGCIELKEIVIPEGVKEIREEAFEISF